MWVKIVEPITTEACRDYYRHDRQPPNGLWGEVRDLSCSPLAAAQAALGDGRREDV